MSRKALPKDVSAADRAQWTPQMVEERLAEAASVLGRLPAMHVYGYTSLWPRLLVEYSSVVCHRPGRLRLPPPEPAAISRMEETLGWSGWLTADRFEDRMAAGEWTALEGDLLRRSAWRGRQRTSIGVTPSVSSRGG